MSKVRAREREEAIAYKADLEAWKDRLVIWKAQYDRILQDVRKKSGDPLAGEAALRKIGPEPQPPPLVDRTVCEPTFEGLTNLFAVGQPSLGLLSDEGGQFLGGHAMNSDNRQKTLAAFNSLWDGRPIKRTRAGDGHETLFGRRLAIHLMARPSVARTFMADPLSVDTGFLARFLICEPLSAIGTRLHKGTQENWPPLARFGDRLAAILARSLPIDPNAGGLEPRCL